MSFDRGEWLRWVAKKNLDGCEMAVAEALTRCCDDEGRARPGWYGLRREADVSAAQARRAIKTLRDHRLVHKHWAPPPGETAHGIVWELRLPSKREGR